MSQILLSFHCRHSSLFQQLITHSTHILKQEFDEKNLNTNLRTGCETEFFRRVTIGREPVSIVNYSGTSTGSNIKYPEL